MLQPITVGVVVETKELGQEVQACLKDLPVRTLLEQEGIGDIGTLLDKIERVRPEVLLVDFTNLKEPHDEFISQVKETSGNPMLVALHKSAEPETIVTVLHAGADAFVYPPWTVNLPKALDRLAAGVNKRRSATSGTGGRTCGFLSAKGGCGATTIACHIAVELARQGTQEVLLGDFDLDAGLIGFLMKSKSRFSVLDAMANTNRLDLSYWRALVSNGIPRLQVVRAPGTLAEREEPRQEDVRTVLRFVRFQYDWVVLDLGRGLNPLVLGGLEEMDEAYLVTTLDVPALHQVKQIVQNLLDHGYPSSRLRLVLNRVSKNPDVMPNELEDLLGIPTYATLPDDYASLYEAYAEGQLLAPASLLGKQLARMAGRIAGIPEQTGKKKYSIFGG